MAKSPVGGSRAYLKGRIGSDVYTLGKDGKGKRQQIVRSLAEEVANPRTSSQMYGRMIMNTVSQAEKALKFIIDHSFDGAAVGQPSITQFIRSNYGLLKADALAHPSSGNKFGLKKFQEKGITVGAWNVSRGKAYPRPLYYFEENAFYLNLGAANLNVGALKKAWGLGDEGYITLVYVIDGKVEYTRVHFATSLADSTALTAENLATMFTFEGNVTCTPQLLTSMVALAPAWTSSSVYACNYIVSEKHNSGWKHSNCSLIVKGTPTFNSDVALPTYPVGTEQFLNGGDL